MAEHNNIPAATRHNQALATDPNRSAWVTANAGSGKTYVLSRRVIRLMLDGAAPAQILCLTFTKAAAAEMSNRIFETLSEWAGLNDQELSDALEGLLERLPTETEVERSRTLFALALDTPGGLKIQTIHAFCEALLHQFPLEANMSGHFQVIEANTQDELIALAREQVFSRLEPGGASELQDAVQTLLRSASDAAIDKALAELIDNRHEFLSWINGDPETAINRLWHTLGLKPGTSRKEIIETVLSGSRFDPEKLAGPVATAHAAGGPTNTRFVEAVNSGPDPQEMLEKRVNCLLTKDLAPRQSAITKPVLRQHGELADVIDHETELTLQVCEKLKALHLLNASKALFTVGNDILANYQDLKNSSGLADFDDLIQAAAKLLTRSDIQQWVRYKLDAGIDHVLVDEAQDTSPDQWAIINAITDEFHTEIETGGRNRSIFVVGDEKQSIYSFQGADPHEFAEQAQTLERKSLDFNQPFSPVRLELSFRSSPDILDAVDKVFSIDENFRGLSQMEDETVHESIFQNRAGEVQIWPLYGKQKTDEQTSWYAPVDATESDDPAILLARRIAITIKKWLQDGEWLSVKGRAIRSGDILILVRRRDKFTRAVLRELKRQDLSIAGADRLELTAHIAIEDLMALGRFTLMRENDLSLAGALKSPLFGYDDDLLTEIAAKRGDTGLFAHMEVVAEGGASEFSSKIADTVQQLKSLETLARTVRPYEFYAHLLGREGGRKAFISHLGKEVEDVLDAFLQAALDHERSGGNGLEEFLILLETSPPEIKREVDTQTDEIQVITVHSAKGLEAPVVFLVDPCSPAFIPTHRPTIMNIEDHKEISSFVWVPESKFSVAQTDAELAIIRNKAEEEYRRLLYVAMTRAANRLIVCGWHGVKPIKHDHWHSMVSRALENEASPVSSDGEFEYLVWHSPDRPIAREKQHKSPIEEPAAPIEFTELPDWLVGEAPLETVPVPSLAPSQIPVTNEAIRRSTGLSVDGSETLEADTDALEKGLAVHRLLEILPSVEAEVRKEFAVEWLNSNLAEENDRNIEDLAASICEIMANEELAPLFGPNSQGETVITGLVNIAGEKTRITGRIDRLADCPKKIILADYKTNASPPRSIEEVPGGYVLQLALYRQVLKQIQPDKAIECMLVWTQDGSITVLPEAELERAFSGITRD
ncbi:MAG: double-strand break repair helicase AddA [Pseudomonadota bacterium]